MNDLSKISTSHLCRAAYIYLRQSTPAQVEHNRESTQRQYALASKATTLRWPSQQVVVIDEDLGVSGSGVVVRNGFARLTAEVALGHVGIVLRLEVSRLRRRRWSTDAKAAVVAESFAPGASVSAVARFSPIDRSDGTRPRKAISCRGFEAAHIADFDEGDTTQRLIGRHHRCHRPARHQLGELGIDAARRSGVIAARYTITLSNNEYQEYGLDVTMWARQDEQNRKYPSRAATR